MMYHYPHLGSTLLGPVVRMLVSANPGLNFNQGFFFFSSKALTRIIFYIFLEYPIIKLYAKRIKLNLFFKLSYLSSNFALALGYLNPPSNNLALAIRWSKLSTNQRHYPDLGSQMHHQHGISALVSQMSFQGETSGGIVKWLLLSQARQQVRAVLEAR